MSTPCLVKALVVGSFVLSGGCRLVLDLDKFENSGEENPCAWQPYHFDACEVEFPAMPALLTSRQYLIDTSAAENELRLYDVDSMAPVSTDIVNVGIVSQPGGPELAVLMFYGLTIESDVEIRAWSQPGVPGRPLVLASWELLELGGMIDVSSNQFGGEMALGAGANWGSCGAQNGQSNVALSGGGGGAFGGKGGSGGRVNSEAPSDGGAEPAAAPTLVRGGCLGGNGLGEGSAPGGESGSGGGAVLLASNEEVVLVSGAVINAGGEGGQPGSVNTGGGGGGSGGFIGLDAPEVTIQSGVTVAANGGGGAGANHVAPSNAMPGQDGRIGMEVAEGGAGDNGVSGGDGQALLTEFGGPGTESNGASGGGGGSVGYIVHSPTDDSRITVDPAAEVSPEVTELPEKMP